MASQDPALQSVFTALSQTQLVNYVEVSALAFIIYSIAITMDEEIKHVWRQKFTFVTFLYLFARYYGLIHLLVMVSVDTHVGFSESFCIKFWWYYSIGGPPLYVTVINTIFILRINALYGNRRRIFIFLCAIVLTEVIVDGTLCIITTINQQTFPAPLGLPWPGCLVERPSQKSFHLTLLSWVTVLSVALTFFCMTLYKTITLSTGQKGILNAFSYKHVSPMVNTFLKDGTVFFFAIFSVALAWCVLIFALYGPLERLGNAWLIATFSYSGARLILNLRIAAARPTQGTQGYSTASVMIFPFEASHMSSVQFGAKIRSGATNDTESSSGYGENFIELQSNGDVGRDEDQ